MSCNKNKTNCTKTVYDTCVESQLELPSFSTILDEPCVNIKDIHEDLYSLIGTIKEDINLSSLDNECIIIPSNTNVKEMFQILITTVCNNIELITTLQEELATAQEQITQLQQNNCP